MKTNDEIYKELQRLERKINKINNLLTQVVKTLHLVPVTEAEEREIQLKQRENTEISKKVYEQLEEMTPVKENINPLNLGFDEVSSNMDIYRDVLGDEFLGG